MLHMHYYIVVRGKQIKSLIFKTLSMSDYFWKWHILKVKLIAVAVSTDNHLKNVNLIKRKVSLLIYWLFSNLTRY